MAQETARDWSWLSRPEWIGPIVLGFVLLVAMRRSRLPMPVVTLIGAALFGLLGVIVGPWRDGFWLLAFAFAGVTGWIVVHSVGDVGEDAANAEPSPFTQRLLELRREQEERERGDGPHLR